MTLTAGSIDVYALLDTAAAGPLAMIDATTQETAEAEAQALAKDRPEIAIARALVVVSGECARWHKAFTDETARASSFAIEIADVLDPVVPAQFEARNRLAAAAALLVHRLATAEAAADAVGKAASARIAELEAEVERLAKMVPKPPPADRRSIQLH